VISLSSSGIKSSSGEGSPVRVQLEAASDGKQVTPAAVETRADGRRAGGGDGDDRAQAGAERTGDAVEAETTGSH